MQKIIIKIPLITLLLGCNPSENYLKNHEVFPYSMEIVIKTKKSTLYDECRFFIRKIENLKKP